MTSNNEQARSDGSTQKETSSEALKGIAQNPDAYAAYLADLESALLKMKQNFETLQTHVRVHARGQRVAGDKFGQARLRALPLEASVRSIISGLESVTKGMEKSSHRHFAHAEKVQEVAKVRKDKALEKERKKNPLPRPVPSRPSQAPQAGQGQNFGYSTVESLRGLTDRETA
ncbi:hypothetical protein ACOKM5_43585 [Streptomyces sp. BH097]|uniref:hypothetical protein n=1 Tax=unclassified Streptomyces TaxID=2593676 RepID=UPI003BB520BF